MTSYEPEIESIRTILGPDATEALLARERRQIFSIDPELRLLSWAGATLLATAAGLVLKNNLDRIGPLALSIAIGLAAAACYAWTWWRRKRVSIIDDYVLLLGALLLSADAGFIESQFHLLGGQWQRHFLILAIAHGAVAYLYRSRMVLTLSITALASWLGVEAQPERVFDRHPSELAPRMFLCAAILIAWREADRRLRTETTFSRTFEHFAAMLGLLGGIALMLDDSTRVAGSLLTMALAALVILWGFKTRAESFVLYAFLCAVLAVNVLVDHLLNINSLTLLFSALSIVAAIAGLIVIHARFPREAT
jgi:hypothetical protein